MAADKILRQFDLVETALKEAKGALENVEESEDVLEYLTAKSDVLTQASMNIGQAIYGQQQAAGDTEEKKEHS